MFEGKAYAYCSNACDDVYRYWRWHRGELEMDVVEGQTVSKPSEAKVGHLGIRTLIKWSRACIYSSNSANRPMLFRYFAACSTRSGRVHRLSQTRNRLSRKPCGIRPTGSYVIPIHSFLDDPETEGTTIHATISPFTTHLR